MNKNNVKKERPVGFIDEFVASDICVSNIKAGIIHATNVSAVDLVSGEEQENIKKGVMIDIKPTLESWESELKHRVSIMYGLDDIRFNIIKVGDSYESNLYVNNKIKKARYIGIEADVYELPEDTDQETLNQFMIQSKLPTILQLPIPDSLDHHEALSYLNPTLDVDGLGTFQKGLLSGGYDSYVPATAKGVIKIIRTNDCIQGQKVVIINRSELIGKPLFNLILEANGTPVMLHSKTPESILRSEMQSADIIITGCGKRKIFDSSYFSESGQTIIDCSMFKEDGIPGVGDLDLDSVINNTCNDVASGYGYTGPATILGLLENVIKCYEIIFGGSKND